MIIDYACQYFFFAKAGFEPNVAYQEVTLHAKDGHEDIFSLIPNVNYEPLPHIKCVALVATRTISENQEILATYFTLVS